MYNLVYLLMKPISINRFFLIAHPFKVQVRSDPWIKRRVPGCSFPKQNETI